MKKILVFALLALVAALPAQAQRKKKEKNYFVMIITDSGEIKVRLYNQTPAHRDNFLALVKAKYYDETLFHRVIKGFMIQGGDPDSYLATDTTVLGNGGPGYTLEAEIVDSFYHKRGALAAARLGDLVNPSKASSGSQFYIVQGRVFNTQELNIMEKQRRDTSYHFNETQRQLYTTVGGSPHLDGQYTVFGEVVEGMDVVDKIAAMPVGPNNRPKTDIHVWMRIVKK